MFQFSARLATILVAITVASGCESGSGNGLLSSVTGTLGSAAPAATPTATPDPLFVGNVGYWKLNDAAGSTTVADSSSLANGGTVGTAATLGSAGHSGSTTSATFDGTTNSIVTALNIPSYTFSTQITVSAWIKTSTVKSAELIINGDNNTANQRHFQFRTQGTKMSCLLFFTNNSTINNLVSLADVTDGNWHHVACSYDGNAMRLYIDGVLNNSVAETRAMNVATPTLTIGQYWGSISAYSFVGSISHVGLWNRALSDSEITDLSQR